MKVNDPNIKYRQERLIKKLIIASNYITQNQENRRYVLSESITIYQDPNKNE